MEEGQGEEDWEDTHEGDMVGELEVHRLVAERHRLVLPSSSLIEDSDIPPQTCKNW